MNSKFNSALAPNLRLHIPDSLASGLQLITG